MAKIKIRGMNDVYELSNDRAKKLKAVLMDIGVDKNYRIDLGNMVVEKKDVVAVFLDFEGPSHEDREMHNYVQNRKVKLAEPLDKVVNRQKRYFELCKKVFGLQTDWESVLQTTQSYMELHPSRIWCDPHIWIGERKDLQGKNVDDYEESAIKLILSVNANETAEENYAKQEMDSIPGIRY